MRLHERAHALAEFNICQICMSNDHVMIGGTAGELRIINASNGEILHAPAGQADNEIHCIVYSFLDQVFVVGSRDRMVRTWEPGTGAMVRQMVGHTQGVLCASVSEHMYVRVTRACAHSSCRVCTGSADNGVRVWDLRTGVCVHTLNGHTDRVTSVAMDGARVVSGSYDRTVRVWRDGQPEITITAPPQNGNYT